MSDSVSNCFPCRKLIATHPDNYEYHDGLRASLRLESAASSTAAADSAALTAVYAALAAEHPESSACRRIPLDFLTGDAFAAAAEAHMRRFVCRGIPSLFADLRPLLADAGKAAALWAILEKLRVRRPNNCNVFQHLCCFGSVSTLCWYPEPVCRPADAAGGRGQGKL